MEVLMRYPRQNKIIELISQNDIETQEELARMLNDSGFQVTQATVSRDIKELKLVKILTAEGKYKYSSNTSSDAPSTEKFTNLLKNTMISSVCSGNMVVVKALGGCAGACCEAIDALQLEHILGTIAGDNTIFIVMESEEDAPALVKYFNDMIKK